MHDDDAAAVISSLAFLPLYLPLSLSLIPLYFSQIMKRERRPGDPFRLIYPTTQTHTRTQTLFCTLFTGVGTRSQELHAQNLQQPQNGEVYFSVSPSDHTVVEGLPVTLRCEAEPEGEVTYSWKIDGQPLAPSPRRHQRDGDLVITRVNRMLDSGSFVCVATHEKTGTVIDSSPAKIDIQCEYREVLQK